MALISACGTASALDSREAGLEAARAALTQLGRVRPVIGFVFASHDFAVNQVLNGVIAQVGDTPLIGFKTPGELSQKGLGRRSVVVALLAGADLQAHAEWWPGYTDEGAITGPGPATEKMLQVFESYLPGKAVMVVADGLGVDSAAMVRELREYASSLQMGHETPAIFGSLSGGDLRHGRAFQMGGQQAGSGGLAAAVLSGKIKIGIGTGHGWGRVGPYFKVTRTRGLWIRAFDGLPVNEVYAQTFGCTPREWSFPPLNELVRLYPLALESADHGPEQSTPGSAIRAPIRIESDGSLRMNSIIPEGTYAHLLSGSADYCLEAARRAAREALDSLRDGSEPVKPVLALILVDAAWQHLLTANPGKEVEAVQSVIGKDVPVAGGYTFGQISPDPATHLPELLNEHIQVILLAESQQN
jgi:hypothetical protein